MTEFDKILIDKADRFGKWDYRDIKVLEEIADTAEARKTLRMIRMQMRDECLLSC